MLAPMSSSGRAEPTPGASARTPGASEPAVRQTSPSPAWTPTRIALTVGSALVAVPFLLGLWLVLVSALRSGDPHGFVLLGGTFLVLVAGIVLACLLPWLFSPAARLRAFGLALLGYLVVAVVVGITLANV